MDDEAEHPSDVMASAIEDRIAKDYPRLADDDDYTYWQWVIAEEYFELENAASPDVVAEIQSRIDHHAAKFKTAKSRRN